MSPLRVSESEIQPNELRIVTIYKSNHTLVDVCRVSGNSSFTDTMVVLHPYRCTYTQYRGLLLRRPTQSSDCL